MSSKKLPKVIPSKQLPSNKKRLTSKQLLGSALAIIAVLFVGSFFWLGWHSFATFQALLEPDLSQAQSHAQKALPIARIFSPELLGNSTGIRPLRLGLETITTLSHLGQLGSQLTAEQATMSQTDFSIAKAPLQKLEQNTDELYIWAVDSRTLEFFLNDNKTELVSLLQTANTASTVALRLLEGEQHWLIMFQNSDELRATGGFMGSYALVHLEDGKLIETVVEDIYDADGQFEGFIEAPPGVNEYLSSNRGLRLPDANWDPDFANSAQQILRFFSLGKRSNIDGVIAVNLSVAESLLALVGPIKLPDYETEVTNDTIATVLRSERDSFFPGSIRKKHLIQQLLTQVQLKIAKLPSSEYPKLLTLLDDSRTTKDIQAFALDEILQNAFSELELSGVVDPQTQTDPIILVESNVGINKANRKVERRTSIQRVNGSLSISIKFTNNNLPPVSTVLTTLVPTTPEKQQQASAAHLGYINYHRLLIDTVWQLDSILIDNHKVPVESERVVKTSTGTELREYGFLVKVPEQTTSAVELRLTSDSVEPIEFFQQSGIKEKATLNDVFAQSH
ncbi:DUF4012 domain-containing protein [Candidatus Woesebacteria bacterium]|nr:DUF4012 domain-containing protein [Candidatus Woesebacteria bacterium]